MSRANFKRFSSDFIQMLDAINGGRFQGLPPYPDAQTVILDTRTSYFDAYVSHAAAIDNDPQWRGQPLGEAARGFLREVDRARRGLQPIEWAQQQKHKRKA